MHPMHGRDAIKPRGANAPTHRMHADEQCNACIKPMECTHSVHGLYLTDKRVLTAEYDIDHRVGGLPEAGL